MCRACGIEKPIGDFNKSATNLSGYEYQCRECRRKRGRELYHAKKEKANEVAGKYANLSARELQAQVSELLSELRTRGFEIKCTLSFTQFKEL